MIGKHQLIFDGESFVKGMTTGINTSDGGFTDENNYSVNITAVPGVLHPAANSTDKTGVLSGVIIASTGDAARVTGATYEKAFITNSGKVLTSDSAQTLTERQAAVAGTFQVGTTDMVEFASAVYVSNTTNVVKLTSVTTPLDTKDETWGSVGFGITLQTGTRRPMIAWSGALWVADRHLLHKYDGTTFSASKLVLKTGQEIVALGIDPSSGKMIISLTEGNNYSNTLAQVAKVLTYDGFSAQPTRETIVDEMVTAFYPLGGVVFVAYGVNLGYWNGAGISFLRKFKTMTLAANDLAYKHRFTSIGKTLYVVDGFQLLAYGEVLPGRKVFYFATNNPTNTETLSFVCNLGSNLLGLGVTTGGGVTGNFYTFNITSVATAGSGLAIRTPRYNFPRPVYIRSAYLEFNNSIADATGVTLTYQDHLQGGFAETSGTTNNSGAGVYVFENVIGFLNNKVRMIQFHLEHSLAIGLRRLVVFYDVAE